MLETTYRVSKKLRLEANNAVEILLKNSKLVKKVLPDPLDNFVVWRGSVLDLSSIDPEKVILTITYDDQQFILIWNKPEDPHHG